MPSMEGFGSTLPDEIMESVLSFLPVPALCRCRSVCKTWNQLLCTPSFLDLCDVNGRKDAYLFVVYHKGYHGCYHGHHGCMPCHDAHRRTTCFLDLDARRWYSIPVDASFLAMTDETVLQLLAMDDGLVCALCSDEEEEYNVVMFDPVARTRWELPEPVFWHVSDDLPKTVTVVDKSACSFKVYIMNVYPASAPHSGFFVYESSTHAWRVLPYPPEWLGVTSAESAVFFQGNLYATFCRADSSTVLLLSYNPEENLWREVLAVRSTSPGNPELVVIGNRMFMAMWLDAQRFPLSSKESSTSSKYSMFEIKEILVDENSSRSVVRIPNADVQQLFGEDFGGLDIADGFPINSNSVVFSSRRTGKLIIYDARSGSVGTLPAHPLRRAFRESNSFHRNDPPTVRAKLMNLSLRNILSGGPVTSRSQAPRAP